MCLCKLSRVTFHNRLHWDQFISRAAKPVGDLRGDTGLSRGSGRRGEKGAKETSQGTPTAKPCSEGASSSPTAHPKPLLCQMSAKGSSEQGQPEVNFRPDVS